QEIVRGVSKLFLWPRGATFWRGGSNLARSKQLKRRTRVPSPDAVPRETSSQTRDSAPALPPLAFAATLFPTAIRDRRRGPGAMANRACAGRTSARGDGGIAGCLRARQELADDPWRMVQNQHT